jgi:hypothetical protein
MAKGTASTPDHSGKNKADKHGFLGPLYTGPGQNLGAYPVSNGMDRAPMPPDPLGLNKVKKASGKKDKAY